MDRFIWCDLETTGLAPDADEILALGLIVTDNAFKEIARFERFVHVPIGYKAMRDMSPFVLDMHTRSGLLERVADSRLELADVEREACAFLTEHLGEPVEQIKNRPVMSGNSVHFDRMFLAAHCPELLRHFNYRLLDVSSLKVLAMATVPGAREWDDSRPPAPHTPLADLEGSIAELAHWRAVLSEKPIPETNELSLRAMQKRLPWTIPYSRAFVESPEPHRNLAHDTMHVMKSLGRIAALAEDFDHGRPPRMTRDQLAKELADLPICAMHMANTNPLGVIDLHDAVVTNSELRNKAPGALSSSIFKFFEAGQPPPQYVPGCQCGSCIQDRMLGFDANGSPVP